MMMNKTSPPLSSVVVAAAHSYFIGLLTVTSLLLLLSAPAITDGLSTLSPISMSLKTQPVVSKLLETHSVRIDALKDICKTTVGAMDFQRQPYCNDVFYLRYCLGNISDNENNNDDVDAMQNKFRSNLQWRMSSEPGGGKAICTAAATAIEQATSAGAGTWKNEPVLSNAPYAEKITKYITPSNAITTTSKQNDLIYCIRAGSINDNELMKTVSIAEMVQFFLYAKEINTIVSNIKSVQYDKLVSIITCNDLSGVKLIGGSSDFRKALSQSSTMANEVYPANYTGPTLLVNLPALLAALVQLFTPLFPETVRAKLKFVQGPLKNVQDLRTISSRTGGTDYETFATQLETILYK